MSFSRDEYCDMHILLGECHGNTRLAARRYGEVYGPEGRRLPSFVTFQRLEQRVRETGSVDIRRPERAYYNENQYLRREEVVLNKVWQNPRTSARKMEAELNIPKTCVNRITKKNGLLPYHFTRAQMMKNEDYATRRKFCRFMLRNQEKVPFILWTDECTFTRQGMFNIHNEHTYALENPYLHREGNMQNRFKINVWAGIFDDQIIGPYPLPERLNVSNFYLCH